MYGLILKCRHALYDSGRLKSYSYDVPVISIGNITVGGTGKTPHAELLIRLLKDKYRIALVSRGYRRKTKGYRLVSENDAYEDVGDEPLQIKKKFPSIIVAVDALRKRAIETLLALPEDERPELFILDDAFQHREVRPSLSIVLVDYSKPIFEDHLLPFGSLRDLPSQIKRADVVIVTKVPEYEEPDRQLWREKLRLKENQTLFFSKITYGEPKAIFPQEADHRYIYSKSAFIFSGIADDRKFRDYLSGVYRLVSVVKFPDHHDYTTSEIHHLENIASKNFTSVVITTEKDAQRVLNIKELSQDLKSKLFYLPIESEIVPDLTNFPRAIAQEMKSIGEQQLLEHL